MTLLDNNVITSLPTVRGTVYTYNAKAMEAVDEDAFSQAEGPLMTILAALEAKKDDPRFSDWREKALLQLSLARAKYTQENILKRQLTPVTWKATRVFIERLRILFERDIDCIAPIEFARFHSICIGDIKRLSSLTMAELPFLRSTPITALHDWLVAIQAWIALGKN